MSSVTYGPGLGARGPLDFVPPVNGGLQRFEDLGGGPPLAAETAFQGVDPRTYFICNRQCNLLTTGSPTDLSANLTTSPNGPVMAEVNFTLYVVNTQDPSGVTQSSIPGADFTEDFALYGAFHSGEIDDQGTSGQFGDQSYGYVMTPIGLHYDNGSNSLEIDKPYRADLLLSHSNMDAVSQSTTGRVTAFDTSNNNFTFGGKPAYAFPVTYRKRIKYPAAGSGVYPDGVFFSLTLVRSPSVMDDVAWNKHVFNSYDTSNPFTGQITMSLPEPLHLQYYVVYDREAAGGGILFGPGTGITQWQTETWQGERGFATNISLTET